MEQMRSGATMPDTWQIENRCGRLARAIDAHDADEVALLRAARCMKGVHRDLRRAAWAHGTQASAGPTAASAGVALDAAERDLRRVLLDHASLRTWQMRDYLIHALDRCFETLDLLR